MTVNFAFGECCTMSLQALLRNALLATLVFEPSGEPRKKHLQSQVLFSIKSVLTDGINPSSIGESPRDEIRLRRVIGWI